MKAVLKRIICGILMLMIIVSSVTTVFVVAQETIDEPQLPVRCQTLISAEGIENTFGDAFNALHANTKIALDSPVDLSAEDIFELDVFVEDIEALTAVIDGYRGNNEQGICFVFGSSARSSYFAQRNYALVDITAQITDNGWNHIRIGKKDFTESSINWSNVRYAFLRFADYSAENDYAALNDKAVKIKNICSVFAVPDAPSSTDLLFNDLILGQLGKEQNDTFAAFADVFSAKELEKVDFSNSDIISADLKIADRSALQGLFDGKDLVLNITLYSAGKTASAPLWDALEAGDLLNWYRASILTTEFVAEENFDWSVIDGFAITFDGNDADTQIGDLFNMEIAVANVGAIVLPDVDENTAYGKKIYEFTEDKVLFSAPSIYKDFAVSGKGDYIAANDAEYVELDLFVIDCESFKNSFNNVSLEFVLSCSGDDLTLNSLLWKDLQNLVTHNGWNHIILPIANAVNNGFANDTEIKQYKLSITGDNADGANPYAGNFVMVENILLTKYETPEINKEHKILSVLSENGKNAVIGNKFTTAELSEVHVAQVADFTGATFIEFDFYIQNYELYKAKIEEKGITEIRFRISSHDSNYARECRYLNFADQIKHSGWNHIRITYIDASKNSSTTGVLVENEVDTWQLLYAGSRTAATDELEGQYIAVTNVAATMLETPTELPANVISRLGTEVTRTYGKYMHYVFDRVFEERITPVDFSRGPVIEFDVFIEDYDMIMETIENSETSDGLSLILSSTIPSFWDQYSKPRSYYNTYYDFTDQIVKDGWNHIVIGKADFIPIRHVVDWSGLTSWAIRFTNAAHERAEECPVPNLTLRVANIVNTGVVANIPKDADKEIFLDKSAVYISGADALSDTTGTWNPATVATLNDYKTEGTASISFNANYTTDKVDARMFYLLDETADMSDLSTLKLDFFVDLPQNIQKQGNTVEVIISDNRNIEGNGYSWKVDLSKLSAGWNSLEFNLSNATVLKNGGLSNAKSVHIQFSELNLDSDNFEEILVAVDNLRYVSNNGNTTLKINGMDDDDSNNYDSDYDLNNNDDDSNNYDNDDDFEVSGDEYEEPNNETVTQNMGKTKFVKNIKTVTKPDFLVAGIVVGVEALIVASATVLFILLYNKKRKK